VARPKKVLTPEQVTQVETLAAVLTLDQIADYLGISNATLRRRISEDKEILSAYKKGKQRAVSGVATSLLTQAREGNITAMIFYLKTQAGWRETNRVEHSGQIDMSKLSDEQLEAIARGEPSS
jgi:hypothetical protein